MEQSGTILNYLDQLGTNHDRFELIRIEFSQIVSHLMNKDLSDYIGIISDYSGPNQNNPDPFEPNRAHSLQSRPI